MLANRRLIVTMGLLLAAGTAEADSRAATALDPALPLPGTAFDEARAMALAPGQRMICDTDSDKPALEQPGMLEAQPGRGPVRVRRCSVFADTGKGAWGLSPVATVAGPARLWLVFVEQGLGGRFRLAQLRLAAGRDHWDRTAAALGETLGPGAVGGSRYVSWQDSQHETLMFVDDKYPSEFKIVIDDLRLRRLLRSPGAMPNID